ncbi:maleylacetoacetate isomerase [Shewanella sp. NIFS-20-20]|uniref:maleylacetoacetate isomerase n=1 Tax=Shewanella sp. NIFS-20-20 TaxID=2853806 RepID=UPI001C487423|nr:maleylacetoacetate isomerase [Shewanella sp. NIFS-20-20]MBV7314862.1 maleylacetoacetate isomerase [Shewanella sp. NIFS-20-20]
MLTLYGYWRSSAAYRVRIALGLKSLAAEQISVHLVKDGGEQHKSDYQALNPQQLVPTLMVKQANQPAVVLTQSLAIIEYLEECYPANPLLPANAVDRAHVRAMAQLVACDTHPLNNLRVLQYLEHEMGQDSDARKQWYHAWIHKSFKALETLLSQSPSSCCFGDTPTLADICLIPQVYNAKRFGLDMSRYPHISRVNDHCLSLAAFIQAIPENQADAN